MKNSDTRMCKLFQIFRSILVQQFCLIPFIMRHILLVENNFILKEFYNVFYFTQAQLSFKVPEITISKLSQHEGTFQYMVNNFTTLDCAVCSKAIVFRDILWRIFVMPINDSQSHRMLGFYLHCEGKRESPSWSCDVAAEFRLLSFKFDQNPYVRKVRHLFCSEAYNWGFNNFISWNDVVNPVYNYVENDCIVLEVHIVDWPQ